LLVAVYFLPSFLVVAIGKGQLQNRHPKARHTLTRLLGLIHLLNLIIVHLGRNKRSEQV
jgi:hypothetical protein